MALEAKWYPEIYATLRHKTRLCLKRTRWRWGKPYDYNPTQRLIRRLSAQFNISTDEAYNRLMEMRKFLIKNPQYF